MSYGEEEDVSVGLGLIEGRGQVVNTSVGCRWVSVRAVRDERVEGTAGKKVVRINRRGDDMKM